MTTATPPPEYQAAAALGEVLRLLDPADTEEAGLVPVTYQDHVANTVVFTVNGTVFHAVVTAA